MAPMKCNRPRSVSSLDTDFSTANLPKFVIRSLVDQYESQKHLNDERKKRISSMRKVYGNIERDKIKRYNSVKELNENKSVNFKEELKSSSSEHDNFILSQNNVTSNSKDAELKDFKLNPMQDKKCKESKKRDKTAVNKCNEASLDTAKNLDRYIKNLKQTLREKSTQLKLDLPPLCQCNLNQATSWWENDWSACANNCLFYKNPKGDIFKNKLKTLDY